MAPKEIFASGGFASLARYGIESYGRTSEGLSRRQKNMLSLALRAAESSEVTHRHGAIITRGGAILSIGVNKWRNRDLVSQAPEYNPNLTTHAEIDALSRVKNPQGATVYIARVGKDGAERFSRPCDNCAAALAAAGVKQVVYTVGIDSEN